ncbi:MAG: glycosyltransferase, partial [Candidatus Electrothrix sp. AR3]|nr:glycosyltransferase [Candidatus Electrothrix sp. AR3]
QFPIIYHFQKNKGPAVARNRGVSLAQGNLVFFTDADCVPDPDWLEKMALPFSKSKVAAVQGVYRTEQKSLVARFAQIEFAERYAMLEKRDSIDMIATYSAGFRKAVFLAQGGFDTRFPKADNEDTEFSYRMAEQGFMMVFAPQAVIRHLDHPHSVGQYFRLKFGRGFWRMMVYRIFPGKMIKDTYTPQSLKFQIISLFGMGMSLFLLLFTPLLGFLSLLCSLLFFLVQSIPFTLAAFRQDRIVGVFALFLLALRGLSIGSGELWGLIRMKIGPDVFAQKGNSELRKTK